jgi:hypothetical protein
VKNNSFRGSLARLLNGYGTPAPTSVTGSG